MNKRYITSLSKISILILLEKIIFGRIISLVDNFGMILLRMAVHFGILVKVQDLVV